MAMKSLLLSFIFLKLETVTCMPWYVCGICVVYVWYTWYAVKLSPASKNCISLRSRTSSN